MNLSFNTIWPERMGDLAGKPNYFIEKIWRGLIGDFSWSDLEEFRKQYRSKFNGQDWDKPFFVPEDKLHTIRYDPHDRWKSGMKIHYVIYNRTKKRFQFAPVGECVSTQDIKINYSESPFSIPYIRIDQEILSPSHLSYVKLIRRLAINDGFPSIESFFNYFNEDLEEGWKIIHWTDLKY